LLRIGGLLWEPARSLDDSSGHMADFNVLRNWKIGDTREFTEEEIRQLEIDGAFDSYDQLYEIEDTKWKINSKVAYPNASTLYILECVEG